MPADFDSAFSALKGVFGRVARRLAVKTDTSTEYTLVTKTPSPLPQHKGEPLYFGCVRSGKAYVSFHLMTLYMSPELAKGMSPELKKRMQGKTCFNFKTAPPPELLKELEKLTVEGLNDWRAKKWA
jgi:hypothetical protein